MKKNLVNFIIKPPLLQNILEVILDTQLRTIDWYNKNIKSRKLSVTHIKEVFCYIAYSYGYSRREIGKFIGSDTGSSVPYHYDKIRSCIITYEADSKMIEVIIQKLIRYERCTVNVNVDKINKNLVENLTSCISISTLCLPVDGDVYLEDIEWRDKPLRDISVYSSTEYQIVKLSTKFYKLVSAYKGAGKAM